ncbi:hypothetical protein [Dactylosporangium sp. NPDC049140]|uniref:hypothetical protein n=1 Tax=Dactylosporangium sp. NPDC049140 TaxID=3155647 RepID=UPI0033F211CA
MTAPIPAPTLNPDLAARTSARDFHPHTAAGARASSLHTAAGARSRPPAHARTHSPRAKTAAGARRAHSRSMAGTQA